MYKLEIEMDSDSVITLEFKTIYELRKFVEEMFSTYIQERNDSISKIIRVLGGK